jgi:hypothetical protein
VRASGRVGTRARQGARGGSSRPDGERGLLALSAERHSVGDADDRQRGAGEVRGGQPWRAASRMYQSRADGSLMRCTSRTMCHHGNCEASCFTIASSGYSAANPRINSKLREDRPFMSGKLLRRSRASLSIILAPHPSWLCRSRIRRPMSQYSMTIAELAANTTRARSRCTRCWMALSVAP